MRFGVSGRLNAILGLAPTCSARRWGAFRCGAASATPAYESHSGLKHVREGDASRARFNEQAAHACAYRDGWRRLHSSAVRHCLGIMNSFTAIAGQQDTSLAVVAPGIAEALFATALGLVAAIPAVVAYNQLTGSLAHAGERINFAIATLVQSGAFGAKAEG